MAGGEVQTGAGVEVKENQANFAPRREVQLRLLTAASGVQNAADAYNPAKTVALNEQTAQQIAEKPSVNHVDLTKGSRNESREAWANDKKGYDDQLDRWSASVVRNTQDKGKADFLRGILKLQPDQQITKDHVLQAYKTYIFDTVEPQEDGSQKITKATEKFDTAMMAMFANPDDFQKNINEVTWLAKRLYGDTMGEAVVQALDIKLKATTPEGKAAIQKDLTDQKQNTFQNEDNKKYMTEVHRLINKPSSAEAAKPVDGTVQVKDQVLEDPSLTRQTLEQIANGKQNGPDDNISFTEEELTKDDSEVVDDQQAQEQEQTDTNNENAELPDYTGPKLQISQKRAGLEAQYLLALRSDSSAFPQNVDEAQAMINKMIDVMNNAPKQIDRMRSEGNIRTILRTLLDTRPDMVRALNMDLSAPGEVSVSKFTPDQLRDLLSTIYAPPADTIRVKPGETWPEDLTADVLLRQLKFKHNTELNQMDRVSRVHELLRRTELSDDEKNAVRDAVKNKVTRYNIAIAPNISDDDLMKLYDIAGEKESATERRYFANERNQTAYGEAGELPAVTDAKREIFEKAGTRDHAEALQLLTDVQALMAAERARGNGKMKATIPEMAAETEMIDDNGVVYIPSKEGTINVIGDLHGDSHTLQEILTKTNFFENMVAGKSHTLVFMGDYVDRGPQSPRVMEILLALKKKYPENIVIIGADHEVPDGTVSEQSFPKQIRNYYDTDTHGEEIYQEYTKLFGTLPFLVATGSGAVISHGGMPKDYMRQDLSSIAHSANQNQLKSEITWADPTPANVPKHDGIEGNADRIPDVPNETFDQKIERAYNLGNIKYSQEAVKKYLERLGGAVLYRAHQSAAETPDKTELNFGGLLVNIHSTGKGSEETSYGGNPSTYGEIDQKGPIGLATTANIKSVWQ
jgi:hypothetical protein